MRVLVDGSSCSGIAGGIARYAQQVVARLAARAEVTVLTSTPGRFSGVVQRVVRIPPWTDEYRRRVIWQLTMMNRYCTPDYDVMLCPVPVVPPLSAVPVVPVVHDLTPLVLHRWHGDQHKSLFWLSLQTVRRAAAVITDSEHTRRDLCRYRLIAPERIHVAPLGVAVRPAGGCGEFAASLRPYLLYVGCLYPHKNLVRLVSAFRRVSGDSELRLVIAGTDIPQWVARIQRAVAHEHLENRVVMLGAVSDPDLVTLYRHCEAFVFPSLYEGFGLPVLEAMANGAPVVCSRESSVPEVAGDAAAYFDPRNTDDMTRAISSVLASAERTARMRQEGLRRSEQYSWDRTAEVVHEVLSRAGARRRRHSPRVVE